MAVFRVAGGMPAAASCSTGWVKRTFTRCPARIVARGNSKSNLRSPAFGGELRLASQSKTRLLNPAGASWILPGFFGLGFQLVDLRGTGKQRLAVAISDVVGDGDGRKVLGWSAAYFDVVAG